MTTVYRERHELLTAALVTRFYVVAVNANRSAECVHYDHCIIRTRSFHIEERNRTIQ